MRSATRLGALIGLIFGLLPTHAANANSASLAVHWQGARPCIASTDIDFPSLPRGMTRAYDLEGAPGQQVFRSDSGARIIINPPRIRRHDVFGRTFSAAYADILKRRPLQLPRASEHFRNNIKLASIRTLVGINSHARKEDRLGEALYSLNPERLIIRLTPRISITNWADYATADLQEQTLWDKHYCESLHHEIAHLLVLAQSYEEALTEAESILAADRDALASQTDRWFRRVSDLASQRQEAYHGWIAQMGPTVAEANPYLSLDFPWLRNGFDPVPDNDFPQDLPQPERSDFVEGISPQRQTGDTGEDRLSNDEIEALILETLAEHEAP